MELLTETNEGDNLKTLTRNYILTQVIGQVTQVKWGFKVLIVDAASMRIIDAALDMKQITEAGVSATRLPLPKLDGIYFISPTDENVRQIVKDFELADDPMYNHIHLFFTSRTALYRPLGISEANMKLLAQSKAAGRIKTLREAHLEYLVYDSHVFHFDSPKSFYNLYSRQGQQQAELNDISDKLATVMATLGEYPIIRYSKSNGSGSAIASLVFDKLEKLRRSGVLKGSGERSTLLIVDRTHDLVSPIVHELTYQSMVEDLVSPPSDVFNYTFVDAENKSQTREVILNENDVIWKKTRFMHIQHAKTKIANDFKTFREQTKDMHGGHDITKTLRAMPRFQTLKSKFSVHLNLAKECMDIFNRTSLERLCNIEQDLATGYDEYHNKAGNIPTRLVPLLNDGMISKENKIRLLMLYYLTEEKSTEGRSRFEASARLTSDEERVLTNFIALKDLTTRSNQRRKPRSDSEWEFVVSRYLPALHDVVSELATGNLPSKDFPFLNKEEESQTSTNSSNLSKRQKPTSTWGSAKPASSSSSAKSEGSRLIVFVTGGLTYSEIREAHVLSAQFKRDIIIGSTHLVKPNEFLTQVGALTQSITDKAYTTYTIASASRVQK